jgi:hypothetical protein
MEGRANPREEVSTEDAFCDLRGTMRLSWICGNCGHHKSDHSDGKCRAVIKLLSRGGVRYDPPKEVPCTCEKFVVEDLTCKICGKPNRLTHLH